MAGTRSNRTFSESLDVATGICEEKEWEEKVGHIPERAEQADLDACGAYHLLRIEPGSRLFTTFISPFGTIPYMRMPFEVSQCRECVQQGVGRGQEGGGPGLLDVLP